MQNLSRQVRNKNMEDDIIFESDNSLDALDEKTLAEDLATEDLDGEVSLEDLPV